MKSKLLIQLPKDPVKLVFQVIWILATLIPMILWAVFMKIFPRRRKSLKGEIVLITGAGSGIGRELAMQMADKGCKLALVDINKEAINAVAVALNQKHENTAKAYVANLGISKDIKELAQQVFSDFERVDILVNNAGLVFGHCKIQELQPQEVDSMFQINVISHFKMIREFLPGMLKRNHGHIVAMSSIASLASSPYSTLYCSTKWAVTGMMQSLRDELQEVPNNQVKVSTVCPYFINSGTESANHWACRVPPMPVQEAVKGILDGIRTDTVEFTIPGYFRLYCLLRKIVPDRVRNLCDSTFYGGMIPMTETERSSNLKTSNKILDAIANSQTD